MKKLAAITAFVLCGAIISPAQHDIKGLSFEAGYQTFQGLAHDWCFYASPYPYGYSCRGSASGSFSLKLAYWQRNYSRSLPLYVEAGLGLRYFPNKVLQTQYEFEADTPGIVLAQSIGTKDLQSLYIHLPIQAGYRFNIRGWPVDARIGIYTDLPVFGKIRYDLTHTYYYSSYAVQDTSCHCTKLIKKRLDAPETYTEYNWESKKMDEWDHYLRRIIGLSAGVNVSLPSKGRHSIQLGYRYERALNPNQFDSHKILDYHSLAITLGFNGKPSANPAVPSGKEPGKNPGFVFGTDFIFQTYDDGYTKNMSGFTTVFAYNTALGICPELRLLSMTSWKGYDNAGAACIGVGLSFSQFANGYLVPRMGFLIGINHSYDLDDSNGSLKSLYAGLGFRFPNTGHVRMELSANVHYWSMNQNESGFQPLQMRAGAYYFFGKSAH